MQVTIEPARYLCSESCATLCALYITCRPSKKRTVREVWRACSSLWVTMTMVRPSSLFNLWSSSMTSAPILESRLPVGSSARMMSGLPTMARAMATRWHWPPESCVGKWRMRCERPTFSSTATAASRRSLALTLR